MIIKKEKLTVTGDESVDHERDIRGGDSFRNASHHSARACI